MTARRGSCFLLRLWLPVYEAPAASERKYGLPTSAWTLWRAWSARSLPVPRSLSAASVFPSLLVFAVAAFILAIRHPFALLLPEPWADEAAWYTHALAGASPLEPYAGYLLLGPRLIAAAEALAAPRHAPLVGAVLTLLLTAGVAALIASNRLAVLIPNGRKRLVLATGFVLLPASSQVLVSVTNSQWVGMAYLLVMAGTMSSRWWPVDVAGMTLAGLSGPGSMLLLPVFVARWLWRRDRHGLMMLAIVATTAAIQAWVLTWAVRIKPPPFDPLPLPAAIGLQGVIEPLIGTNATLRLWSLPEPLVAAFALVLLGFGYFAARRQVGIALAVGYVAFAAMVLGMMGSQFPTGMFVDPWVGERYFYLAGLWWMTITVLGLPRLSAAVLGCLLIFGATGDLITPPLEPFGWAERTACIGGPVPCRVIAAPGPPWVVEYVPD